MKKQLLSFGLMLLSGVAMAQTSHWTQSFNAVSGQSFNRIALFQGYVDDWPNSDDLIPVTSMFTIGQTQHTQSGSSVSSASAQPRYSLGGGPFDVATAMSGLRATGYDVFPDPTVGQFNDEVWLSGHRITGSPLLAQYSTGSIQRRILNVQNTFTEIRSIADHQYFDISINKNFGGVGIAAVGIALVGSQAFVSTSTNNGVNWTDYEHTTTESAQLRAVKYASEDVIYAAGGYTTGTAAPLVLKSTDGGANWVELTVGISGIGMLRDLSTAGEDEVWAVGAGGKIIHTDNGGTSWSEQTSGTVNDLVSVCFLNSQNGWASGGAGTIRKTNNGGQTWTTSPINTTLDLMDIAFVSEDEGVVIASNGEIFSYTPCTPSFGVDVRIACTSLTWIDGNTYTEDNNTATHYLIAANGCDSIVTLNLTMVSTPVTGTAVVESQCESYTWIDGVTYTTDNSTATYTIVGGGSTGCDSIVTLNLTFLNNGPITGTATAYLCPNSLLTIGGQTITQTGTYTEVLLSAHGCDSTVTWTVVDGGDGDCFEWEHVPGARLINISCGSASRVVGIATGGSTWIVNANTSQLSQQQQNNFTQISVSADGTVWGFGPVHGGVNNLWRATNFNGLSLTGFSSMPGFLYSIATATSTSAYGHSSGSIYRYNGTSWSVHSSSGLIDQVSCGPDLTLWGKDQTGFAKSWNGSTWVTESNDVSFSWIAVGDAGKIAGISQGQLYLRINGTFLPSQAPNPNGSQLIQVDLASDGTVYMLTDESSDNVYRSTWNDLLCAFVQQPSITYDESTMTLSGSSIYTGYVLTLDGQEVASGPGSSLTYNVTEGGVYEVRFGATESPALPCPATASVNVSLNPVNIAEAANGEFRMYPNPANTSVTLDGLTAGSTITVMDAMGRTVRSSAATASRMEVSVAGLSTGIYMVQVQEGNGVRTVRLMVN